MVEKRKEIYKLLDEYKAANLDMRCAYAMILQQKIWELQQMVIQFYHSCNEELLRVERLVAEVSGQSSTG